jgi:hypothetical protein
MGSLRSTYRNELQALAFSEIPDKKLVLKSFMDITQILMK